MVVISNQEGADVKPAPSALISLGAHDIREWETRFAGRLRRAIEACARIDRRVLASGDCSALTAFIVDRFAARPIHAIEAELRVESALPRESSGAEREIVFVLPCEGAASLLFSDFPSVVNASCSITGTDSRFEVIRRFPPGRALAPSEWLSQVRRATAQANVAIGAHRAAMSREVAVAIELRSR